MNRHKGPNYLTVFVYLPAKRMLLAQIPRGGRSVRPATGKGCKANR